LIQQALQQVLSPIFEADFSASSYGFRPGRNAHQAVNAAKSAVARPWERKFLGYSLTWHKASKLRIAPASYQRLENRVREVLKGTRGRSLTSTI